VASYRMMSIGRKTRRAVVQRRITARRVFRPFNTYPTKIISGSDSIIGLFGSLAPPNVTRRAAESLFWLLPVSRILTAAGFLLAFWSLQSGSSAQSAANTPNPSPSPVATNSSVIAGVDQLQPVTVTGYIVPRVGDGPQPVLTLDQEFIQKQGDQTVADVLLRLPENLISFTPQFDAGENYSAGASAANLRGLGADKTLVLVDGERQAAFPFPQNQTISFVDLNSIPLAAVDRIEVLKDGASATYGSDAIAGVVNVILKDSYQGADLKFYYGISQRGDYEQDHASLVGGIAEQLNDHSRVNVLATFDYYEQGPIDVKDRGYAAQLDHSIYGPYLNWQSPTFSNPVFFDARGNTYTVKPGTTGPAITKNDFFYPNPVVLPGSNAIVSDFQLEPREERLGTYVKLNYQPEDFLKFYQEFSYQRNKESAQVNPYGAVATDNLTVPANNPFNPFGFPLTIERARLDEFGPLKTYTTIDTVRTLTGATLFLPHQPTGVFPEDDSYGLPDFKMVTSLFYSKEIFGIDRFRIGLTLNYIDSEHDFLDNFKGTEASATLEPNGTVHLVGSWTTLDLQVSYSFGWLEELAPSAPRPGYSSDGKNLLGEDAILPKAMGRGANIRTWLAGATVTFGVNNLEDSKPPFSDTMFGYDETTANPIGRYFYVELEKKF
jgi:outer membrane receptor protein involved in Fe transport